MGNLARLEFLNLSFNVIKELDGFVEMHGQKYRLKYLDLKGNNIIDMKQISFLAGCHKLQDLIIRTTNGQQDNPISKTLHYERIVFDILPQLVTLDGFDFRKRAVDVDNGSSQIAECFTDLTFTNEFTQKTPSREILDRANTPKLPVPEDFELRERVNALEKKMENIPSQNITKPPEDDRLRSLQGQIEKLVEVIVAKPKATDQLNDLQDRHDDKAKSREKDDRLEKIESQMNEILKKSVNSQQKEDKTFRKQKAVLKMLENQLLPASSSSSGSSEKSMSLMSKKAKRVLHGLIKGEAKSFFNQSR